MASSIMSSKGFYTDCDSDYNEASARAPRKQWGTSPRARKEHREKPVKFANSENSNLSQESEPIREPQPTPKSAATPVDKPMVDQSARDVDPSVRRRVIGSGRHQIPGGNSNVSSHSDSSVVRPSDVDLLDTSSSKIASSMMHALTLLLSLAAATMELPVGAYSRHVRDYLCFT